MPTLSAYAENGEQLAALANAETILLDDGTEVEAPQGIKDVFVLTLRKNDYALIPMPLTGTLDHRCLSLPAPGLAVHGIGTEP